MSDTFTIPHEYHESFRRLLPHMAAPLRGDEAVLQAILLYLKLGSEKLARIAIDAFNENHRLTDLENRRRLRDEALLRENLDEPDEEEETEYEEADGQTDNEDDDI